MRFEEQTIDKYKKFLRKERLSNILYFDSLLDETIKEKYRKKNNVLLYILVVIVTVFAIFLAVAVKNSIISVFLFGSMICLGAMKDFRVNDNIKKIKEADEQNRLKKAQFKIEHNLFLYKEELLDENLLAELLNYSKNDIQWVFDTFNKKYCMQEKSFERTILTYVVKLEEDCYEIRDLNIQNIKKYSVEYLAKQIVKEIKMSSSDENILKES